MLCPVGTEHGARPRINRDAYYVGTEARTTRRLAVRGTRPVRSLGCHRQRPKGVVGVLYESQLIRRRVPCFDPLGQSMLHPDASGMKHGARETHENHLGFVYDTDDSASLRCRWHP